MKRDYEIYIYGGLRAPTLVLHSIHFNDLSAIQRARTFAGDRRFEVWSDNYDTDLDQSLVSTLVFRSFDPRQNPLTLSSRSPANLRSPNNNITAQTEQYEFRLCSSANKHLLFAGTFPTEDQALEHTRRLLNRHKEMDYAEVWRGMKLVRQV